MRAPLFLMTEADHFDVSYQINPWMDPAAWRADAERLKAGAGRASCAMRAALRNLGAEVRMIPAAVGCPDLVFPANAAVVLDGRVLLARFRHSQRQAEQVHFRVAFEALAREGLINEIIELPQGVAQEGAGDCIWDAARGHFWAGHGPRSSRTAIKTIEETFDRPVVDLELASERFYHLDTCFCPLSGGEIVYYPDAFTPEGLDAIERLVPRERLIEASDAEAAAFCVNAVNLDRHIVMAKAPLSLRRRLLLLGYRVTQLDLGPFMMSGGAAYCMTLRIDRNSTPSREAKAA
jgi:N-dimethylarginine dimethylaminohydrolase